MKIMAAVDRSNFADCVVDLVSRIAPVEQSQVLIMNVAPREPDVLGQQLTRKVITDPVPEGLQDRRDLLDRLAAELDQVGISCETLLIRGAPAPTIIAEADRWGAELVVVGSQGRGMIYRKFLGSTSEKVLEARRFPVLVVPMSEEDGA